MPNVRPDEYIKTDRNGTKYYKVYRCPRCGGKGSDRMWANTGFTCFMCNGTGEHVHIVKEYTPEYLAKQAEKNRIKEERKIADRVAEYQADMTKAYREVRFNDQGRLYIVTASNTYDIKEDLKAAGARWYPTFQRWGFQTRPDEWETLEISFGDFYRINEYGVVRPINFEYAILEKMLGGSK